MNYRFYANQERDTSAKNPDLKKENEASKLGGASSPQITNIRIYLNSAMASMTVVFFFSSFLPFFFFLFHSKKFFSN